MTFALKLLAAGLLAVGTLAQAAPVTMQNAAYAATYVRDCRSIAARTAGSGVPDRCEVTGNFSAGPGVSTLVEVREQTALGGFTAATGATNFLGHQGGQATRSEIDASGAAGVLTLRQAAFSQAVSRTSGHSVGLQSFYYDGTGPATRTLLNTLDFLANVTPTADLDVMPAGGWLTPTAYAKTRVTVFSLTVADLQFDPELGPVEAQSRGFWGQAADSGYGGFRLEGQVDNLGIMTSGTETRLDFTMEAGRYYFVESYLGLWARFGGLIDASHTFTSQLGVVDAGDVFSASTEGLVFADESDEPITIDGGFNINTVPEPGALVLALSAALLALRRRR